MVRAGPVAFDRYNLLNGWRFQNVGRPEHNNIKNTHRLKKCAKELVFGVRYFHPFKWDDDPN